MRYLVWALRLIVFVVVLMFALKNTAPVAVAFFGVYEIASVPLIVVMLTTFVLGAVFAANPEPSFQLAPDAIVPLSPL